MRMHTLLCATLLGVTMSALGHHSFIGEFDPNKPFSINGLVSKIEWTNPHARFYVAMKDDKGALTNWEVELGSPNTLIRYGWKRDSMKVGDAVVVDGFLARDGSKLINAKSVKMPDGQVINAGSSQEVSAR